MTLERHITVYAVALTLAAVACTHPPRRAWTPPSSAGVDAWGRPIETVAGDAPGARLRGDHPEVLWGGAWASEPEPAARWAWLHEVAHHVLGHVALGIRGADAETAADCEAVRRGGLTALGVVLVVDALRRLGGSSPDHLAWPWRAAELLLCWRGMR